MDGKTKVVDLGSHIFVKNQAARPQTPFSFSLVAVMNDGVDDDNDNYELSLRDYRDLGKTYLKLVEQENLISIPAKISDKNPH